MSDQTATAPDAPAPMTLLSADVDFEKAARLVVAYLNAYVPMALWSVTRVENGRQTFLFQDEDNGYQVGPGHSHRWEDSFCIHMAAGNAPAVAPDAQAIPRYATAGVNRTTSIGSYAGAVILEPHGNVFGAICGIDPANRSLDPALAQAGPLLTLFGQLLSMVVCGERGRETTATALLESQMAAEIDELTSLYNRRAWARFVSEEESRFRRLADPTVAVILDLDLLKSVNDTQGHAAGDRYIKLAGEALRRSVKSTDVVARLGGDEFAVLLRGCTEADADGAVARIYRALADRGVSGSIGWAPITVLKGFPAAIAEADAAMYAAKATRRLGRLDAHTPAP